MKKVLIFLVILCILLILGLPYLSRINQSYGYFIKGPNMNFEHSRRTSMLELENGNILILGENLPNESIKSEIYDVKSNKFKIYELTKDNIYYLPEGILLKDNKLLLTFVHNPEDLYEHIESDYYSRNYNSMAIIDLSTNRVEKFIRKKINQKYEPNQFTKFAKLGNGNIILIDFDNKVAEIYNPQTNSSKVVKLKYKPGSYDEIVPVGENKILIFGGYWIDKEHYKHDEVTEYKDNSIEIISVGNVLPRESSLISKVSENKIIIAGGGSLSQYYTQEIEIYDVDTNQSNVIGKFIEHRQSRPCSVDYSGAKLSDRYFMIAGGNRALGSFGEDLNSTDIIDLKNNSVTKGPKMIYTTASFKMVKLTTGNILCIFKGFSGNKFRSKTQILKLRKELKL